MYKYRDSCMTSQSNYLNNGADLGECSFNKALESVEKIVQDGKKDEFLYDYLISIAPTEEEKEIIKSIREEVMNSKKWLREIYKYYTCKEIQSNNSETLITPESYIEGIREAIFAEMNAMEKHRVIKSCLPSNLYEDTIFRIITDDIDHTIKFNYILSKNSNKRNVSLSNAKSSFTKEEAGAIALLIGIDFTTCKFDLDQFWMGVNTELEHGRKDNATNVTADDPILTGKITLAHLNEFPDYYTRLKLLEEEAKEYWSSLEGHNRQREFTLNELAEYDGTKGKPAYVAVNGIVYDVSKNSKWNNAKHFGLTAGKDLSSEFKSCHGVESKLKNLPKVGVLKV